MHATQSTLYSQVIEAGILFIRHRAVIRHSVTRGKTSTITSVACVVVIPDVPLTILWYNTTPTSIHGMYCTPGLCDGLPVRRDRIRQTTLVTS